MTTRSLPAATRSRSRPDLFPEVVANPAHDEVGGEVARDVTGLMSLSASGRSKTSLMSTASSSARVPSITR
jgi:hypothetical protein